MVTDPKLVSRSILYIRNNKKEELIFKSLDDFIKKKKDGNKVLKITFPQFVNFYLCQSMSSNTQDLPPAGHEVSQQHNMPNKKEFKGCKLNRSDILLELRN